MPLLAFNLFFPWLPTHLYLTVAVLVEDMLVPHPLVGVSPGAVSRLAYRVQEHILKQLRGWPNVRSTIGQGACLLTASRMAKHGVCIGSGTRSRRAASRVRVSTVFLAQSLYATQTSGSRANQETTAAVVPSLLHATACLNRAVLGPCRENGQRKTTSPEQNQN